MLEEQGFFCMLRPHHLSQFKVLQCEKFILPTFLLEKKGDVRRVMESQAPGLAVGEADRGIII